MGPETKLRQAMQLLERAANTMERAPDPQWWADYFRLTGQHMVLTEEGWVPAALNTREETREEPMEVLVEVKP